MGILGQNIDVPERTMRMHELEESGGILVLTNHGQTALQKERASCEEMLSLEFLESGLQVLKCFSRCWLRISQENVLLYLGFFETANLNTLRSCLGKGNNWYFCVYLEQRVTP